MAEQAPPPHRITGKAGMEGQPDASAAATGLDHAPAVRRLQETARTLNARPAAPAQRKVAGMAAQRSSPGVVQARFKYLDTVLEEKNIAKETIPARLTKYRTSEKIYQIRDDWDADFVKPMHLIGPDAIYLLGEHHDRSEWAAQTAQWSRIAKVREGAKSVPGYEQEAPDRQDLPLDSLHAFLLHVALLARGQLLLLKADSAAIPPAGIGKEIAWAAKQIIDAESEYLNVAQVIVENEDEAALAREGKFIARFTKLYVPTAVIMKTVAEKLVECAAVKSPDEAVRNKARDAKALLLGDEGTLTKLALDLTRVSGIRSKSDKGKAIAAEAKSDTFVAPAASAAMSVREAAMAANIKGNETPSLVQVGDGHVESLGSLVAGSTKVRADDRLEKHTKV